MREKALFRNKMPYIITELTFNTQDAILLVFFRHFKLINDVQAELSCHIRHLRFGTQRQSRVKNFRYTTSLFPHSLPVKCTTAAFKLWHSLVSHNFLSDLFLTLTVSLSYFLSRSHHVLLSVTLSFLSPPLSFSFLTSFWSKSRWGDQDPAERDTLSLCVYWKTFKNSGLMELKTQNQKEQNRWKESHNNIRL